MVTPAAIARSATSVSRRPPSDAPARPATRTRRRPTSRGPADATRAQTVFRRSPRPRRSDRHAARDDVVGDRIRCPRTASAQCGPQNSASASRPVAGPGARPRCLDWGRRQAQTPDSSHVPAGSGAALAIGGAIRAAATRARTTPAARPQPAGDWRGLRAADRVRHARGRALSDGRAPRRRDRRPRGATNALLAVPPRATASRAPLPRPRSTTSRGDVAQADCDPAAGACDATKRQIVGSGADEPSASA